MKTLRSLNSKDVAGAYIGLVLHRVTPKEFEKIIAFLTNMESRKKSDMETFINYGHRRDFQWSGDVVRERVENLLHALRDLSTPPQLKDTEEKENE